MPADLARSEHAERGRRCPNRLGPKWGVFLPTTPASPSEFNDTNSVILFPDMDQGQPGAKGSLSTESSW